MLLSCQVAGHAAGVQATSVESAGGWLARCRGRGALVKSSNGVIAGNRFFNLKGFAIQLAPENAMESDFVHDILVADNTINSYGAGVWLGQDPMNWGAGASGFTNNYNVRFGAPGRRLEQHSEGLSVRWSGA